MTTVAVRDRVMAADSGYSAGDLKLPAGACGPKIVRSPSGWLFSFAGSASDDALIANWICFKEGMAADAPEVDESTEGVVLKPDGTIWGFGGKKPSLFPYTCPFIAVGSGRIAAMAAMHAGASAERAVEIACECNHYTRPPVQVERL